jgi:hypothetical protein
MLGLKQGRERGDVADFVSIEKGLGPEGRIAVVRFDRGDGINALSPEALRQLTSAARSFEDDASTSVVVLTGGAKAFSGSAMPGRRWSRSPLAPSKAFASAAAWRSRSRWIFA